MKILDRYLKEQTNDDTNESVKAIIKNNNLILILRRQVGSPGAGMWDLPGGAIKKGEDKIEALKRETKEESGLNISNIKIDDKYKISIPDFNKTVSMNIYTADTKTQDVKMNPATWDPEKKPEHNEFRWISRKTDLKNLPMLDDLKDVVLKQLE